MKKKLSIVDLAKQLNISPTTVSFILNGKAKEKRISDELVERVLKFIEEVGYKPNLLAQSLRTGKTKVIGLMVESISDPFFASIARLIEENAYKNGYKIIYCSTDNDTDKTKDLIRMFSDRHVDGYIIAPPEGIEEEILSLVKNGAPVVLFDRYFSNALTDYVAVDNFASTHRAISHLIENGYKNIAFVTLDSLQSQMQDRLKGYEQALSEHNLPHHLKEISFRQDTENTIRHIISFFDRKKHIDAVLFGTNYLAVNGLKAIRRLGLRIPDDLAVISFDDNDLFELYYPSITAIAQPIDKIAEKAITMLLSKLDAPLKHKKFQSVVVPCSLMIRDSTAKLKS